MHVHRSAFGGAATALAMGLLASCGGGSGGGWRGGSSGGQDMGFTAEVDIPEDTPSGSASVHDDQRFSKGYRFEVRASGQ